MKDVFYLIIWVTLWFCLLSCDSPGSDPNPAPPEREINRDSLLATALYDLNTSDHTEHGLVKPLNPGYEFPGEKESYLILKTFPAQSFQGGITIHWVGTFRTLSEYMRIVDLGNGRGETGGYNITLSLGDIPEDLILTNWEDTVYTQRIDGRLRIPSAIQKDQEYMIDAIIDEAGLFSIYIDKELKAQEQRTQIIPIDRSWNFVGRSNWPELDSLFHGEMRDLKIFGNDLDHEYLNVLWN